MTLGQGGPILGSMSETDTALELNLEGWRIRPLIEGRFRLDGGAMWGVVPKNLWGPLTPPAEDNTIAMALRCFLCERGDDKVVVEAGVGDRWPEKHKRMYHLDGGHMERELRALGVSPEEITCAVASHGHWDHVGGWVVERDGELAPLFANARHVLPRIELERCLNPDHVRKASYRPDDLAVLVERGQLAGVDSAPGEPIQVLPGVWIESVGGHSDGSSAVFIGAPPREVGDTAVFWGDVVPTAHHIQPPYIMAYDIDVARSFEQRGRLLSDAVEHGWWALYYHDDRQAWSRLVKDGRRYATEAVAVH